ncbi:MAG TPA: DoxX family protein [Polyangia bacterium]|jgi:uncharacterized membrane protein YphA (DoxX/SURF4 family)
MNLVLWSAQGLLAAMFAMAGVMKATRPADELAKRMAWVNSVSPATLRFIGVSELLGALGLVLPWATGIAPILTPLAAAGLVTVMVLAAGLHVKRGEYGAIAINAVIGGLSAFVAWGRFHR